MDDLVIRAQALTAGGDVVRDNPGPFERNGEEEAKREDRNDDRTGCKIPFLRQVDQIRPDLSRPEKFRRFAKVACEPDDLGDIHALVFGVRLRICISSIMRRRSGLRDNSFVDGQRHRAPAHRLAIELSDQREAPSDFYK
jgi:hypothetical protein